MGWDPEGGFCLYLKTQKYFFVRFTYGQSLEYRWIISLKSRIIEIVFLPGEKYE